VNSQFSDVELDQLRRIVKGELERRGEWLLLGVVLRDGDPGVADVTIGRKHDPETTLVIELPYREYAQHEIENEAHLSDAVFNVSIRLLEFDDIRGFEGLADGATIVLDPYGYGERDQ
jgi:hypothetical protein